MGSLFKGFTGSFLIQLGSESFTTNESTLFFKDLYKDEDFSIKAHILCYTTEIYY